MGELPKFNDPERVNDECLHCGTVFKAKSEADQFCCSGCEYVYRLIRNENLDRYYDFRDNEGQPVSSRVFSRRDMSWLEDLFIAVESSDAKQMRLELTLQGISCVGCVWLIDQLFSEYAGGVQCRIDAQRGSMVLIWNKGRFDLLNFVIKLRKFGYEVGPSTGKKKSETSSIVWRLAVCGAFALNSMLFTFPQYLGMKSDFAFAIHFAWLSAIFASGSIVVGGGYFIGKAFQALRRGGVHMDLPISIGLVSAYFVSWYGFFRDDESLQYFDFVSTFVFLMLVGRWIHVFAIERNRSRLADIEIKPTSLERIDGEGRSEVIDVNDLNVGDTYKIGAGEWAPVESELVSSSASMGMDWINGESESRVFVSGGVVPSGAINHSSEALVFTARELWSRSLLFQLLGAQVNRTREDSLTQTWIARYLLTVIILATTGGVAWYFFGGVEQALRVFISALVVSCPCALGIALPLADELSHSLLKLRGVFLNTNTIWNRLRCIRQVVFDKTGTLTSSSLEFVNAEVLADLSDSALLALSEMVSLSAHPVASSLRENLLAKGFFRREGEWSLKEETGNGLVAERNGVVWKLGRAEWAGGTASEKTIFSEDGRPLAGFEFADIPWPDAAAELAAIRERGIRVQILSGDRQQKVDEAAEYLGLGEGCAIGQLLPQEKEKWLADHDSDLSLMVGDGANDSLAFDAALVAGTPAVEKTVLASKADFYYLGTGIQGVRYLLEIASRRRHAVISLVAFALLYNVIILGAALSGLITPVLAAIFMPLSSAVSLAIVWLNLFVFRKK